MRFKKSAWLAVLAVMGVIGLVIARVALAQRPALVQDAPPKDGDTSPSRAPRRVPVQVREFDGKIVYQTQPFWGGWAGEGHDDALSELVQLDAKLGQESQQLIDQYAAATDDDEKSKLKEKLAETLERQFEAQQKLRELEVSRIEARVKKLRELIEKRSAAKRTIIDKRLDQLIRDAEGLGWSSPEAGNAGPWAQETQGGVPSRRFYQTTGPSVALPQPARGVAPDPNGKR